MAGRDIPLFSLVDGKSGAILVAAYEIRGFFVHSVEQLPDVEFVRVHMVDQSRRQLDQAVLRVVNSGEVKIGEYYIGVATIDSVNSSGGVERVSFSAFGNRSEFSTAAKIWRRWATGAPIGIGEWINLPDIERSAWLDVVQNSWFASNHRAARYGDAASVVLDGRSISTRESFFCALGEAVNGPGGYLGSNLDAMADCLKFNLGGGELNEIKWSYFSMSESLLEPSFLAVVMEIMEESGIRILFN